MHRDLDEAERDDLMRAKRRIVEIRSFAGERSYPLIATDRFACAAFERLLQIVSDTSRPVAARWKSEYPAVRWSTIGAIGDELEYAYDRVDLPTIWNVYVSDLNPLEAAIDAMLAAHSPKDGSP
jgi:uncharacterized protein with HEPN domain